MMEFLYPEWFQLLWLSPLILGVLYLWILRYGEGVRLFSSIPKMPKKTLFKLCLRAALVVGFFILLVIAKAQPRQQTGFEERPIKGADILIALDLSTSMLAQDIKPNRLERAKREIIDLIRMLSGDRIGIVVFAGASFVQCPLTEDYSLAQMFVADLSMDHMPVQGTVLGDALELSLKTLEKAGSPDSSSQAVILMTDGEEHSEAALAASLKAKERGVRIYPIGIGSLEGAPVPDALGGFKKDQAGKLIMSRLNEGLLIQIAQNTGGTYVRSTGGDFDLDQIYHKGIKPLGENRGGMRKEQVWQELFGWFAGGALLLLWMEFLLDRWVLGLLLMGLVGSGRWRLEAAAVEERSSYNTGVDQYRKGEFAKAQEDFEKGAQAQDPEVAEKSLFNLGNTLVAQGQMEEAKAAYEKALALDSQDQKAKENLEWVKKFLKKNQDQKPPEDQQPQDKPKDGEQKPQEQPKEGKSQEDQKPKEEPKPGDEPKDGTSQEDQKLGEDKKPGDEPKDGKSQEKPGDEPQDGKPQENPEPQDGKPGVAPDKPTPREEAVERLLQTLDDKPYGIPFRAPASQHKPEKDW